MEKFEFLVTVEFIRPLVSLINSTCYVQLAVLNSRSSLVLYLILSHKHSSAFLLIEPISACASHLFVGPVVRLLQASKQVCRSIWRVGREEGREGGGRGEGGKGSHVRLQMKMGVCYAE